MFIDEYNQNKIPMKSHIRVSSLLNVLIFFLLPNRRL